MEAPRQNPPRIEGAASQAAAGIGRGVILSRGLRLLCPNCGQARLLRSWFHLHRACPRCGMEVARESGFTLGTTSIGYVIALFVVLLPLVVLAVRGEIGFWAAVILGGLGSFLLPVALFPVLLMWVATSYFTMLPGELPANRKQPPDSADRGQKPSGTAGN